MPSAMVLDSVHGNDEFFGIFHLPATSMARSILIHVPFRLGIRVRVDIASFVEQSWVHKILVGGVYTGGCGHSCRFFPVPMRQRWMTVNGLQFSASISWMWKKKCIAAHHCFLEIIFLEKSLFHPLNLSLNLRNPPEPKSCIPKLSNTGNLAYLISPFAECNGHHIKISMKKLSSTHWQG